MKGFLTGCALVSMLLAAAWADHHLPQDNGHDHGHDHGHNHGHDHSHHASCNKLSPANANFGFALYKSLNAKAAAGKNVFFSPLGISSALSMLSTGARGETHSQVFSTLGYSGREQAAVNEGYQHLFHMLGHSPDSQRLDVGSAVAVRSGFSPLEKFLKDVKEFYSGETFSVDFSKPEEAAAQINAFIASKTNNMIRDQVKDLDAELAMMLINYVYFRGQWEKPFNASWTEKDVFHVDENTQVEVDMMKKMGRFDYYYDMDNHTSVIMLPYRGNASMMIVLPDEGRMSEVEGFISKEYLHHWHDSLYRNSVDLFMPKFSISAEADMDGVLKEMGMTDAFGDNADFSGMSAEVKLKLSKVSHKAVLKVDETGTEAAATTTLEIMPMSMPEVMKLNRPFMLFIVEDSTRSILFMGKINNPTAM